MATIQEIVTWLEGWVDSFDFTRPGMDQSLGRDLANVVVQRIMMRCADSRAPDGTKWDENSDTPTVDMPDGYKVWKEQHYGWPDNPNYLTGQMLSKTSLGGATKITAKEVLVAYGTGLPPSRSYAPTGYISEEDKQVKDIEKAEWAHMEGPNRKPRKFYGLGEGDAEAVVGCAQDNMNGYIIATNA